MGMLTLPDAKSFLFPLSKTYIQRGGFNSEILHVHYTDGGKKVVKRIGAKRGGFSLERAKEIAYDVIRYQNLLIDLGVPMPPVEKVNLEYSVVDEQTTILVTSEWTGIDIEIVLNAWHSEHDPEGETLVPLIRELCTVLKRVCKDTISVWEVQTGIDPKPSNFTLDETGKLWYVDPFPPRYHKEGIPIIEWTEPKTELGRTLGYFKYFDIRGLILGFTSQLARIRPELKTLFEMVTLQEFSDVVSAYDYKNFLSELATTPWRMLREILIISPFSEDNRQYAIELICNSSQKKICGVDYSVYTLREIALELASCGQMSKDDLERFFRDSHFEDDMRDEKLTSLQRTLCNFLN